MRLRPHWLVVASLFAARDLQADEGQWMPEQLEALEPRLEQVGLRLAPELLWSENGGLMRAAVQLSGCSASFISPNGLIATNHHCAYRDLQAVSTVENDFLTNGFLATNLDQELRAPGQRVKVVQSITDVTRTIRERLDGQSSDVDRASAERRVMRELVAECESRSPGLRCEVERFFGGRAYRLFETLELRDIRLVYAPPAAIGEYGGEVDNWMWPRHTGDFTLLRAYVGKDGQPADPSPENLPYRPEQWLEISTDGVSPGDFVAVMGYPGHTDRYLPVAEVERHLDQVFPTKVRIYDAWHSHLTTLAEVDPALRIKVAAKRKSLANRLKNARGMVENVEKLGILAARKAEESRLLANKQAGARKVLDGLAEISRLRRSTFERDFLLDDIKRGPDSLAIAVALVRRAREHEKPDIERAEPYTERNADTLRHEIERHLRNFEPRIDAALFEQWFAQEAAIAEENSFWPGSLRISPAQIEKSRFVNPEFVRRALDEPDLAALSSSTDRLLTLAMNVADAQEAAERRELELRGRELELLPQYFALLEEVRSPPLYPDANGTLRMSFATVRGYAPRDGLWAVPQTTLTGQIAKHTGTDPFDLPQNVIAAAARAGNSHWKDAKLEDVPVCFLASGDTTGGNSGSPVIDAYGKLVGLNFDRVWENVAGDFGYDIGRSRNIIVDIRYVLWLIDEVANAKPLLGEVGVDETARHSPVAAASPPPPPESAADQEDPKRDKASGCRVGVPRPSGLLAVFLLALVVCSRQRMLR